MASKSYRIKSVNELEKYKRLIKETSVKTISNIKELLSKYDSMKFYTISNSVKWVMNQFKVMS